MSEFAALDARLEALHNRTAETPLFNPVFQLGAGAVAPDRKAANCRWTGSRAMVAELECEALRARAERLHRLIAPVALDDNIARLKSLAETGDFAGFAARWSRPVAHIVFTAHPTFLLSRAETDAVATAASSGDCSAATVCVAPHDRDAITLDTEHAAAMTALTRAQAARDRINAVLLRVARQRWPDRWQALRPQPLRFASWVGYDMDGPHRHRLA